MKEIVSLTRSNSLYGGKGDIRMTRSDYLNNAKRLSECLFLISLDSFHRVKLNYLSTLFVPY